MRPLAPPRRFAALAASMALSAFGGCRCNEDVFQRMEAQPKFLPYQRNELFDDGRAMRTPPAGTVPREAVARVSGWTPDGGALTHIPIGITPELMARGQQRFDIICSTCHGILGDGDSLVARNMSLRAPPNLHRVAQRPPGEYFEIITEGFGLMPSFRSELGPEERWAVVAYLLALQRSQRAAIAQAPPAERARLEAAP